ncbi:hypothetical protein Tco_0515061 [Tanacetum coccineum]
MDDDDDVLDVLGLDSRFNTSKGDYSHPGTASQPPGWPPASIQPPGWAGAEYNEEGHKSFGLSEVGFHDRLPKLRPLVDADAVSVSSVDCECLSYKVVSTCGFNYDDA